MQSKNTFLVKFEVVWAVVMTSSSVCACDVVQSVRSLLTRRMKLLRQQFLQYLKSLWQTAGAHIIV